MEKWVRGCVAVNGSLFYPWPGFQSALDIFFFLVSGLISGAFFISSLLYG